MNRSWIFVQKILSRFILHHTCITCEQCFARKTKFVVYKFEDPTSMLLLREVQVCFLSVTNKCDQITLPVCCRFIAPRRLNMVMAVLAAGIALWSVKWAIYRTHCYSHSITGAGVQTVANNDCRNILSLLVTISGSRGLCFHWALTRSQAFEVNIVDIRSIVEYGGSFVA